MADTLSNDDVEGWCYFATLFNNIDAFKDYLRILMCSKKFENSIAFDIMF